MKRYKNTFGLTLCFVVVVTLLLTFCFTCKSKKVGPTTPDEVEFDEVPEFAYVVPGEIDCSPALELCQIFQTASDSEKITTELQNTIDLFANLVGEDDLEYLSEMDSVGAQNILSNLESSGELPYRIANIVEKLQNGGWAYFPTYTEAKVIYPDGEPYSQIENSEFGLSKALGPYEDCVARATETYLGLRDQITQNRTSCYNDAEQNYQDCKADAWKKLGACLIVTRPICAFGGEKWNPVCKAAVASCFAGYGGILAICAGYRNSTRNACDEAYNDSINRVEDWLKRSVAKCHEMYGG